ncbi:sensor histidine kinase [Cohnella mopanensis]|uniref:sensor histidine kinase n=1 Tax=Cohnella mopanensis TaxID=2911966 RepID=UPI001EF929E5|nr:HAMP domain-containing sensor histidine kinase [Cohnella mopanensis]
MSIRLKLILSYLAMLIVPLVLLVLTAMLLVVVYQGDLQNLKKLYETKIEGLEESDYHRLIKHAIEQDPALLKDQKYLNDLSAELTSKDTYLYIRSGNRVLFASDGIQSNTDLISELPAFQRSRDRFVSPTKPYGNEFYQFVRYDFGSVDTVNLYLITKVDPFIYFARKYSPYLLVSAIVILVLTNALLTLYMSKKIIKPLMELRKSAMQFKDGKLETPVMIKGKDEIGQLGTAFEEMRSRLRDSIAVQAQYELNRKELIANISHDLKTPITSIRGYVDGLLEGIADSPEKTEKYMRTIAAKAVEMDRLIDELFLYSKLDLHSMPFSFETVKIDDFLNDLAEELHFELEKTGVNFVSDIQVDPDSAITIDGDSFRRVLNNIIQNSLKFMDKADKEIRLAAKTERELLLVIEDNGSGIPNEALPYVFDRFYRAERSRSAETGGSGLGLAIAKQIVSAHGGNIRAESEEGAGSRIIITLPIARRD